MEGVDEVKGGIVGEWVYGRGRRAFRAEIRRNCYYCIGRQCGSSLTLTLALTRIQSLTLTLTLTLNPTLALTPLHVANPNPNPKSKNL